MLFSFDRASDRDHLHYRAYYRENHGQYEIEIEQARELRVLHAQRKYLEYAHIGHADFVHRYARGYQIRNDHRQDHANERRRADYDYHHFVGLAAELTVKKRAQRDRRYRRNGRYKACKREQDRYDYARHAADYRAHKASEIVVGRRREIPVFLVDNGVHLIDAPRIERYRHAVDIAFFDRGRIERFAAERAISVAFSAVARDYAVDRVEHRRQPRDEPSDGKIVHSDHDPAIGHRKLKVFDSRIAQRRFHLRFLIACRKERNKPLIWKRIVHHRYLRIGFIALHKSVRIVPVDSHSVAFKKQPKFLIH